MFIYREQAIRLDALCPGITISKMVLSLPSSTLLTCVQATNRDNISSIYQRQDRERTNERFVISDVSVRCFGVGDVEFFKWEPLERIVRVCMCGGSQMMNIFSFFQRIRSLMMID